MSVTSRVLENRIEHFKDVLRNSSIKLTFQRLEIYREVASSTEHPDAETIFNLVRERIPTISIDTVYRTLWLLLDLGLLTTLGSHHERAKFDANIEHHHHFICNQCGKAIDFYNSEYDMLQLPENKSSIGRVVSRHVELKGICRDCSKRSTYYFQSKGGKND